MTIKEFPTLEDGGWGERYAVLDETTGAVLRYGWKKFVTGPGEVLVKAGGKHDVEPEDADPLDVMTVVEGELTPLSPEIALPIWKRLRVAEIDARTTALIAGGFSFGGVTFSLSLESQHNIHGVYTARSHTALTYPLRWMSKDDSSYLDLVDADAVEGLFLTALGTVRARKDSGTVLKQGIGTATTRAELDAVVDER
jgi:hypothetical protein